MMEFKFPAKVVVEYNDFGDFVYEDAELVCHEPVRVNYDGQLVAKYQSLHYIVWADMNGNFGRKEWRL